MFLSISFASFVFASSNKACLSDTFVINEFNLLLSSLRNILLLVFTNSSSSLISIFRISSSVSSTTSWADKLKLIKNARRLIFNIFFIVLLV